MKSLTQLPVPRPGFLRVVREICPALAVLAMGLGFPNRAASAESEEAVPPPRAPWVATLPERGAWSSVFAAPLPTPPGEESGNPPLSPAAASQPIRIDSSTWNAVKQDVFHYPNGNKSVTFYFAGMALVEGKSSRGEAAPVLVHQLPGTDFSNLRAQKWLALDWLDRGHYKKAVPYQRTLTPAPQEPELCYYYQKSAEPSGNSDSSLPELKAWIRVSDLQPVAVQIGNRLAEFQRLPDPTQPPPMTPEQAAKLLDLKDQHARMEKLTERNKRIRERREQLRNQNTQAP